MNTRLLTVGTAMLLVLGGTPVLAQNADASGATAASASSEGTTDATETPTTDATETPTTDNTTTATSTRAPGDIQTSAESSGNVAVELDRSPRLDTSSPNLGVGAAAPNSNLDVSNPDASVELESRTDANAGIDSSILNQDSDSISANSGTLIDETDEDLTDSLSNSQNQLRSKIGESQAELDAKIEDARSGASGTLVNSGSARIQDLSGSDNTGVQGSATTTVDVQ